MAKHRFDEKSSTAVYHDLPVVYLYGGLVWVRWNGVDREPELINA